MRLLRRQPGRGEAAFGFALVLFVCAVAALIEGLNAQAGHFLPRRDRRADGSVPEWHVSFVQSEAAWRAWRDMLSSVRQDWANRELTPAERAVIREVVANRANRRLRQAVRSAGLMQYVLVPAAAAWCATVAFRPSPRPMHAAAVAGILACVLAGLLALDRGYLSSMGW